MLEQAEKGEFLNVIKTFTKQIVSTSKLIFKPRDGEKNSTSDPIDQWLMAQNLLQVKSIKNDYY